VVEWEVDIAQFGLLALIALALEHKVGGERQQGCGCSRDR
jgi:hypothetical protein